MTQKPVILCVEDEADFREDIVQFLRGEQFEVVEAANGQEGLEKFTQCQPNLVLCDVQMPQMSGLEMLQTINQDYPEQTHATPFIFLTAWGARDQALSGKVLGCDEYLIKPIDFDLLLVTIQSRLNKWQRVQDAHSHHLAHFQSHMLEVLSYHLTAPLQSILSYTDLSQQADQAMQQNYQQKIADIAQQHLKVVENVVDTVALSIARYPSRFQVVRLSALLWEAAVTVVGYDEAEAVYGALVRSADIPVLSVDVELCHRMLRHLIEDAKSLHDCLPALDCRVIDGYIEIVIACCADRLQKDGHWVLFCRGERLEKQLMQFRGVNLLFAREICALHHAELWLELTDMNDPIVKMVFPC